MRLLGFATGEERDWFRLLTGVQGVGSKVGLAILSALCPGELQAACAAQDAAMVARAQGVGPSWPGGSSTSSRTRPARMPGAGMAGRGPGRQRQRRRGLGAAEPRVQAGGGGERRGACAGGAGVDAELNDLVVPCVALKRAAG